MTTTDFKMKNKGNDIAVGPNPAGPMPISRISDIFRYT